MNSDALLNTIDKNKSITVLTNYRTGSTALCVFLANVNPSMNFLNEFWHPNNLEKMSLCYDPAEILLKKKCLIKIHMSHLPYVKNYNLDNTFKIKLYRRNVEEQIISYYIARLSKRWHDIEEKRFVDTSIDIDKNLFYNSYCEIKNCIEILDNIKDDLTLYYEDIPFILNTTKKKNTKPINYDEIKENLHKLLLDKKEKAFWLENE